MVTSPEMTLPVPVVTHTVEIQTETATPKAEKDVRSSPHHESHTITSTSAQTESSPASGKLLAIDVTDTGRISIDLPADMLSDDETIQRERLLMQLYERKISDMQAAADSQKAAFTLRELRWHASDHQLAEARTRNDVLQNDVTAAQKRIFALEESMASVESNYSQQLNMMSEHVLTLNESVTGLTAELGRYRELFGPLPDLRRSPRGSAAATGGKQSGGGRR